MSGVRTFYDGSSWEPPARVAGMRYPARATCCGTVYDLAALTQEGNQRQDWADCSTWRCPGCQAEVSDRRGLFDHRYVELGADGRAL